MNNKINSLKHEATKLRVCASIAHKEAEGHAYLLGKLERGYKVLVGHQPTIAEISGALAYAEKRERKFMKEAFELENEATKLGFA